MLLTAVVYCAIAVAVGAVREPPLRGLVFAATQTQENGQPCPPDCTIDTMEIVTWYPSPYNEYEELRLYPKFSTDESDCNSEDKLGLMYYNKDEQALKVCWQDPSDLSYSWEKIGSEQSGLSRLENYATSDIPSCSSAILGSLVYDTTEKRPYVCALNASNNPVWKPLDSDYDKDGITDAVDYDDTDANDAIAAESDVVLGKTFYSGGVQPKYRKTGTLNAIKGVIVYATISGVSPFYQGCDSNNNCRVGCGNSSGCYLYVLYSSEANVEVPSDYSPWFGYSSRPFKCRGGYERQLSERSCNCMPYGNSCSCITVHYCPIVF